MLRMRLSDTPLDEVVVLIDKCSDAGILAYPEVGGHSDETVMDGARVTGLGWR